MIVRLDIASCGTAALLTKLLLLRGTTLPMLKSVAASRFVHNPSGWGRVGKPIKRGDKLVLRTDQDNHPLFRPHPDWVVPPYWSVGNRLRDLEDVRKTARDMDVQIEGPLFLPLIVVERWSQE